MWGGRGPHQPLHHPQFVPDSLEEEFQVVYDQEPAQAHESAPAGRGGRPRYALPQGSSAIKARGAAAAAAVAESSPAGVRLQPRAAPPAVAFAGFNLAAAPGSPGGSDGGGPAQQDQPLTLAQELQTVLHGLTPAPQGGSPEPQLQKQQQQQQPQPTARPRLIKHTSPSVPLTATLPSAGPPSGGRGSGRRWRQAQEAAAAQRQQQSPVVVPADGGGDAFFAVDDDLIAAAERQALQQAEPLRQQHRQPRGARQAPAAAAAEHTPLPSQCANPLASLLGGAGGSAAKPRAATTGGKLRGRHPLYGHAAAPAASTVGTGERAGAAPSSSGLSGSRLREHLGLREAPLTSPRQQQQQQRRQPPQQQPSRFVIKDPAQVAAAEEAAASQQQQQPAAATSLRQLVGSNPLPPLAAGGVRQQQRRGRAVHRSSSRGEQIVEGEEEEQQLGQQAQQAQHGPAADGGDAFRTPGQPLRRARTDSEQGPGGGGEGGGAAAAAPPSTGGAPGSSGHRGAMSLQRQFIAQLQPVSRPAAAANMQQQKQRLAGATGLHARLQAALAAEKAGLQAQSPAGGAAGQPRLTVLEKELEGSVTKCLCRCDAGFAAAHGAPEAVALLQSRTAREVDTAPGSVLVLTNYRVLPLPGSARPAVLCFGVGMG